MVSKMVHCSFILSTSLAIIWVPVAQAVYTWPFENNTKALNHSKLYVEKRFPKSEDGRCGVNFGTSCEIDEGCSSEG